MKTPEKEAKEKTPTILQQLCALLLVLIVLIIIAPGFVMFGILFYFSTHMIYNELYLWLKYDSTIDVSTYYCLTLNSKYCQEITSLFPFNIIPQYFINWLVQPNDWIGLHSLIASMFNMMPMWFMGYVVAFIILATWIYLLVLVYKYLIILVRFFSEIFKIKKN